MNCILGYSLTFQRLLQAGAKRLGTDESTFNMIMASQSYEQLKAVFENYQKLSGHNIEHTIKSEMSGNLELGMLAIGMLSAIVLLTAILMVEIWHYTENRYKIYDIVIWRMGFLSSFVVEFWWQLFFNSLKYCSVCELTFSLLTDTCTDKVYESDVIVYLFSEVC